jgi:hypothetical protein
VRHGHHQGRRHSVGRGRRRGLGRLDMEGVGWDRGSGRRSERRGDSYRLDGSAFRDRRPRHRDHSADHLDGRSGGLRGRSSTSRWTRDAGRSIPWGSLAMAAAQSLATARSRSNRRQELYGGPTVIPARSTVRATLPSPANEGAHS